MASTLKPGGLGSPNHVGTPPEFNGSMAEAMETALNALLIAEGRPELLRDNSTESRDRRLLFVAIAQGVVNHLTANQAAFTIRDDDDNVLSEHNVHIARS